MKQIENQDFGEVVLYESPEGNIRLDVRLDQESVWLTQAQMAKLFAREGKSGTDIFLSND